jgi:prolyl-tRNA editing enzyme YbaK/EbsC (Cys-tRNA(Pro) deacylase)
MALPRNIKQYLFHNGAGYSQKRHSVAYTAQQIARVEHIPGAEFAKAVVLQADDRMIFAVLPADHVINLEILKRQIGCSKLSPVSERGWRVLRSSVLQKDARISIQVEGLSV